MGLLRGKVADGGGLFLASKAPPEGKTCAVVGGDQLCISADGDNALWVLLGRGSNIPGNHAQGAFPVFLLSAAPVDERTKQLCIQPTGLLGQA